MYTLSFFENGRFTGGFSVKNRDEAIGITVSCVERYAHKDGFYIDESVKEVYTVYDLSPAAKVIKLTGSIDAALKNALTQKFKALLDEWLCEKTTHLPAHKAL
jgi:hypothetical protein